MGIMFIYYTRYMIETYELIKDVKKHYCDVGAYMDFLVYKVNRGEISSSDGAILDLADRLDMLKENLRITATSIKPDLKQVGRSSLDDYIDLLSLKNSCESLDTYIDSLIYYTDWILEDNLCKE